MDSPQHKPMRKRFAFATAIVLVIHYIFALFHTTEMRSVDAVH
jgi:hypothetical protein